MSYSDDNFILKAIFKIDPNAEFNIKNSKTLAGSIFKWVSTPISKEDIQTKIDELQAEYDAQDYARKRQAEYPSVQDLVVALYDTDDKAAIDAKRAEIKLKYPKPGA